MSETLFVVDELYPVASAPAVRIENLMGGLPPNTVSAVGGITGAVKPPPHMIGLTRPSERHPAAFVSFLLRLGRRALREARATRPDTIVLSVPKYELLTFAPPLSKLCRRLVLDVRDSLEFLDYGAYLSNFVPRPVAGPLGREIKRVISAIQRRAVRSAHIVTVANEGIAAGLDHHHLEILPNGVDTNLFSPRGKRPFDGTRPLRLVYLGNFAEKDRFDPVSAVAERLGGGIEVHLIGEGRNKASVLSGLSESDTRWVDHGRVLHHDLPSILSSMDLGFIFRDEAVAESVPVCLFEFAAMGIPSCCNDAGLMASLVRSHDLGFIVSGKTEFLSVIEECRRNPGTLARFGHLHDTAVERFSLQRTARRFAAILDRAAQAG